MMTRSRRTRVVCVREKNYRYFQPTPSEHILIILYERFSNKIVDVYPRTLIKKNSTTLLWKKKKMFKTRATVCVLLFYFLSICCSIAVGRKVVFFFSLFTFTAATNIRIDVFFFFVCILFSLLFPRVSYTRI